MSQISRGTSEIINHESLKNKLQTSIKRKKPLRIKAGFDPTAPDIHFGHMVLLRKLRQFQDAGHQVDFVIGDFTALVGDPSGQNALRPTIDTSYINDNAKTYQKQALKILKENKTRFIKNSHWLSNLGTSNLLALTARSTVAQMLARSDFKRRFENNTEISIMEFIYPLLQGFDSYVLKTDIELGGTDQKFNLLMGRQIQEALAKDLTWVTQMQRIYRTLKKAKLPREEWKMIDQIFEKGEFRPSQDPQVIIMTPLLEGTDGVQKMSKTLGNYIGITEPPNEIFGKVMSISDELMLKYFEILTDAEIDLIKALHPKEAKLQLAQNIVTQLHNAAKAKKARVNFEKTFSLRQLPEKIEQYRLKTEKAAVLLDILVDSKLTVSKNEARRLIKQNAVSHDGIVITNEAWIAKSGVLKVGKRRFLKLV